MNSGSNGSSESSKEGLLPIQTIYIYAIVCFREISLNWQRGYYLNGKPAATFLPSASTSTSNCFRVIATYIFPTVWLKNVTGSTN